MLTKQEKEWFDKAKAKVLQCGCTWLWCTMKCEHGEECFDIYSDFEDAAEFEARVSRCIAENASELDFSSNNWQFFDGFKAKSLAWYILWEARIVVEEKMDQ